MTADMESERKVHDVLTPPGVDMDRKKKFIITDNYQVYIPNARRFPA